MKAADIINDAPFGIIGIDAELQVYGGYDQEFTPADAGHVHDSEFLGEPTEADLMPATEKVILADQMLARWQAYKQAAMAVDAPISPTGNPAHVLAALAISSGLPVDEKRVQQLAAWCDELVPPRPAQHSEIMAAAIATWGKSARQVIEQIGADKLSEFLAALGAIKARRAPPPPASHPTA